VAAADIAAINASITEDSVFATILSGYGAGATGVLATGTTNGTTTLGTIVAASGAPLAQIQVGDLVLKSDIPAGTFVTAVSGGGTSVTLSQAATGSANGRVAFARIDLQAGLSPQGLLTIPKRGVLKILPGDIVAIDNTGWPILVSGAAIGYAGSAWTLT
jgi:hypothetical protein